MKSNFWTKEFFGWCLTGFKLCSMKVLLCFHHLRTCVIPSLIKKLKKLNHLHSEFRSSSDLFTCLRTSKQSFGRYQVAFWSISKIQPMKEFYNTKHEAQAFSVNPVYRFVIQLIHCLLIITWLHPVVKYRHIHLEGVYTLHTWVAWQMH